jgi:hypothetical protein
MKIEQRRWTKEKLWQPTSVELSKEANLVFIFGETSLIKEGSLIAEVRKNYPSAHLIGCSTAGEIYGTEVQDDTLTTTAVHFKNTKIQTSSLKISDANDSLEVGKKLASSIDHKDLKHVFVLSAGLGVNGSELVKGLAMTLPSTAAITGGLAGDKARFQETWVISDTNSSSDLIAIMGFYGNNIKIGSASLGGWDPFGPERLVTKSKGNVLYELDGQSALQLYKKYLGEHAKDLPGSGLLFPLCLRSEEHSQGLVRTILAVDEKDQSLIFAGDIPEGGHGRFMKANFDRLVGGAVGAAEQCATTNSHPDLALLISCVGRKLILKQRVEEEVDGVRDIFGAKTALTGFYSYGEISPFTPNARCELHNQTMTITTMSETENDVA